MPPLERPLPPLVHVALVSAGSDGVADLETEEMRGEQEQETKHQQEQEQKQEKKQEQKQEQELTPFSRSPSISHSDPFLFPVLVLAARPPPVLSKYGGN